MKLRFTLIALSLLGTACNRSSDDLQWQVTGTWSQGIHTLTLGADGTYTSVFSAKHTITYKARWRIENQFLILTDVSSNSVPLADNATVKIVLVDKHRLELSSGTNRIWMTR